MHCIICNEFLSDFEASRIDSRTGKHLDTCTKCWSYFKASTIDDFSVATEEDLNDIDSYYYLDDG